MKRAATKVVNAIEAANRLLGVMGGLAAFAIFAAVSYDVVTRELLGLATRYAVDLSEMLMLPLVYLTAAYVAQVGGNVRVELVVSRLPRRAQLIMDAVATLFFLAFAVLILWQGWLDLVEFYRKGSTTMGAELILWPAVAAIPIGGFFLSLQLVILIGRYLSRLGQR